MTKPGKPHERGMFVRGRRHNPWSRERREQFEEITAEERDPLVPRDFDETTETDIADIAVSVGASGARRPPSE